MRVLLSSLFCLSLSTSAFAQQPGPGVLPGGRWNGGAITNPIRLPDGTCAAPSRTYSADTDLGSYRIGANNEGFCANSTAAFDYNATRVNFSLPAQFTGTSKNLTWVTDGGGNIGASGATRPDNVYVKTSGYFGTSVVATLLDSGADADLVLQTNSAARWRVYHSTNTYSFGPNTNNAYDLGVSNTTVRTGYFGTSIVVIGGAGAGGVTIASGVTADGNIYGGSTSNFGSQSRGYFKFPSDGVFTLLNNAGTDFSRLQFGGTTSSFPGLKRNGSALEVVLADDSTYTQLNAKTLVAVAGGSLRVGATTFASLPASPVEGMHATVTDSTTATWGATITGGGANHVLAYYNGTNWTVAAK
jgi:hypothetical protein